MAERTNRDVAEAVKLRLDARGVNRDRDLTHGQMIDAVVWETLAVLKEWELITLDPKNLAARMQLGIQQEGP